MMMAKNKGIPFLTVRTNKVGYSVCIDHVSKSMMNRSVAQILYNTIIPNAIAFIHILISNVNLLFIWSNNCC